MKFHKLFLRCLCLILAASLLAASAGAAPPQQGQSLEDFIEGVRRINEAYPLDPPVKLMDAQEDAEESRSARVLVRSMERPDSPEAVEVFGGYDGYYLVQYEDPQAAQRGLEDLLRQPGILCAAPDTYLELTGDVTEKTYLTLTKWSSLSDPLGIETLNQRILTRYGEGDLPQVVVAVLDSGAKSDHPLLEGRLLTGLDMTGDSDSAEDPLGHGTFVAGVIADTTLSNVSILPLRVANNSGKVPISAVVAGLEWAVDAGVHLVNMSFGAQGENTVLQSAVEEAQSAGVIVVAAAGNNKKDCDTFYPASYPGVITVSNLATADTIATTSNYGTSVELAAPGTNILGPALSGGTHYQSGTSFSAPFVTAATAMVYTLLHDPAQNEEDLYAQAVELLLDNAVDIGKSGRDKFFGYGRLDLHQITGPKQETPLTMTVNGIKTNGTDVTQGTGWQYDPREGVLFLNNYDGGSIRADGSVTIVCRGENSITGTTGMPALSVDGDLRLYITGTRTRLQGGSGAFGGDGIYCTGDLFLYDLSQEGAEISGGNATAARGEAGHGIHCAAAETFAQLYSTGPLYAAGGSALASNGIQGNGLFGDTLRLCGPCHLTGGSDTGSSVFFRSACSLDPFSMEFTDQVPFASPAMKLDPVCHPDCRLEQAETGLTVSSLFSRWHKNGVTVLQDSVQGRMLIYAPLLWSEPADFSGKLLAAAYQGNRMLQAGTGSGFVRGLASMELSGALTPDRITAFVLNADYAPVRECVSVIPDE